MKTKERKTMKSYLDMTPLKDVVAKYIYQSRPPMNQITTYLFGYEVDNPSADYLRYKILMSRIPVRSMKPTTQKISNLQRVSLGRT